LGSRGDFDNGTADDCSPLRGVDAVDVKIKLRADPSSPPDACSHEWAPISRRGDTAVRLSPARAPVPRDSVAVRVLEFASGFACRFWVIA
jgi:hypothetical protein